jgi:hypothetical protein
VAESRLDVVINPTKAQSGARAVKSSLDSLKNSWVEMTAKIFLAEQAITRVWRGATAGADFEESLDRLNIQMAKHHSTAQVMINDLKNVSNGQLSNAQAAQLASRALMEGLDPDQIKTFTQAADLLGDVMGTDLKEAFDSILQGLATGKTKMLANIGVYVDLEEETKKLALATDRTVDQITKEEKAMIGARAALEMLDKRMAQFADSMPSEADKMKAMEARFDDLILKAQRFAKTIVVDVVGALEKMSKWLQDVNPFAKANKALEEATPGNINNPKTQQILGEAIMQDTRANVARREADAAAAKKATAKRPLDPKLQMIRLEGEYDRQDKRAEDSLRDLAANTEMIFKEIDEQYRQNLITAKDVADQKLARERYVAEETLRVRDDQMTYEKRIQSQRLKLVDSTEQKFQTEEKFKTRMENLERLKTETKIALDNKETESDLGKAEIQEKLGQRIVDESIANYKATQEVEDQLRHKSQDDAVAYFSALQRYQDAYGTSRENQITTEYDMVRANLAKQLDVTYETAEKVLNAWRNGDHIHASELIGDTKKTWDEVTTIMMSAMADQRAVSEKYSDDFFEGFAKSMKKYVNDQSVFGLGVDQARRVAQGMEQGFQRFFFDAMESRIQSFKDVIKSVTDFAKNLVSQVAGTLITNSILRGITMMSGGGGQSIGGLMGDSGNVGGFDLRGRANGGIAAFAGGGIATRPMLRVAGGHVNMIGEGRHNEAYVPLPDGRTIPVTMRGGASSPVAVTVPIKIDIHNEVADAGVQAESHTGADGMQQIKIMITNVVRDEMKNGAYDKSMAMNFGQSRKPRRRT